MKVFGKKKKERERESHKGEANVKIKAQIRIMPSQIKEAWNPRNWKK